jgi:hypothetical protein
VRTVRARHGAIALLLLVVTACATSTPPSVRVTDIRTLAGQYSGSLKEDGELSRSAVLIIETNGKFEVRASDPRGFRTNGELILETDGTLTYTYGEMRGQGRVAQGKGVVYEGDGQRVIVLTKTDGTMTTRVAKSLP